MSKRNDQFARIWHKWGPSGYELTREHRFHPDRQWRFDFAIVRARLAIEIEGTTFFGGRKSGHQTAKGYRKDCEKYNAAVMMGWRVLRYTQQDLDQRHIEMIEEIENTLQLCRSDYEPMDAELPDGVKSLVEKVLLDGRTPDDVQKVCHGSPHRRWQYAAYRHAEELMRKWKWRC